ncbi:IS1380 family transposase, partial [Marinobacter halodurans]
MVPEKLTFSPLARRQIEADFSGGHITSDAGLLLLREIDKQHRLT